MKSPRNTVIAKHCEILVRGLAAVGIIALIDEVTGYEKVKDKDTLQKFLNKFLLFRLYF